MITQKDGRRSHCQIQAYQPVPGPGTTEPAVGEVVAPVRGPAPDPNQGRRCRASLTWSLALEADAARVARAASDQAFRL